MTTLSMPMSRRLMLLASCAAGIGTFGMPAELVGADSPILFRDHFNSSASPAKWKTVNGTWAFQRRKLIGPKRQSLRRFT